MLSYSLRICLVDLSIEYLDWCPISSRKPCWLKSPFEEEEIRKMVISLGGEKALGLDGFAFAFFQSCWGIVM